MFKKYTQKGFTLIELLVVIAIIGILATIVLTSLGSARSKATDSKNQGQLSNLRAAAETYYGSQNPPSYAGLCAVTGTGTTGTGDYGSGVYNLLLKASYGLGTTGTITGGSGYGCVINSAGTAWAAYVVSTSDSSKTYCSDSVGQSKIIASSAVPTATAPVCP